MIWLWVCFAGQAGGSSSGKTVGDLEKTVGLMKKVVERVQKENDALKRTSGTAHQDKLAALQTQHEALKVSKTPVDTLHRGHSLIRCGTLETSVKCVHLTASSSSSSSSSFLFLPLPLPPWKTDYERVKQDAEAEMSARLESKTRGMEKIVIESDRLRRELKRVIRFVGREQPIC